MFTGIVEETGTVRTLAERDGGVALEVAAQVVCDDLRLGDSVAVNGVCLHGHGPRCGGLYRRPRARDAAPHRPRRPAPPARG